MRVLVTGTDGYIGCVMADMLMAEGHEVTGVDAGFYRAGWLYGGVTRMPATLTRDIRDLTADDVAGFEAVVHLAELSNDPLGQLAPDVTFAINHRGSVHLAEVARAAGVPRFVYMSSCSVYGIGASDEPVTEESPVNPLTAYAECKVLVEGDVGAMAGEGLPSHVPAQRHGLRGQPADALRHRAQQPGGRGLDRGRDSHAVRRIAVAPAGSHPRHDPCRARRPGSAGRRGARPGPQCGQQ